MEDVASVYPTMGRGNTACLLVSIFGYGSDNYPIEGYGSDFFHGIWSDYTWGDFCFDGVSMGVLIALSMVLNALFIHLFKPLQDYRGWAFLYSVLLLAMNVVVSMFIMKSSAWIVGEKLPHNVSLIRFALFLRRWNQRAWDSRIS